MPEMLNAVEPCSLGIQCDRAVLKARETLVETRTKLSITKSGDRMLRQLLVQCSQYILGHHGEDSELQRWGLGLATRGGPCAKRKAIVAVARKLAVLMHVLWRQDVDFDPFYRTNSRAAARR